MSRLALLVLWLLGAICAVVALAWQLCSIIAGSPRAIKIALGFDRLGNATAGGDDGEYISSRCWRYRDEQPYRVLRAVIDWAFALTGQTDHCRASYEGELERARVRSAEEHY